MYGSRIASGELSLKDKYRVLSPDGEVLVDNLSLASIKHFKKNVSVLERGNECGLAFEMPSNSKKADLLNDIEKGFTIENYTEKERG